MSALSPSGSESPVVVIGLDAGDIDLIERWAGKGALPTFARLLDGASHGRLDTTADVLHGSVWPSLVTGCRPGKHGSYFRLQLRPGTNELMRVRGDHCLRPPFWTWLDGESETGVIVDVPKTAPLPQTNGLQVVEWGGWDRYWDFATSPPEAAETILREFGEHPFMGRISPPSTTRQRLQFQRRLLRGVQMKHRLNMALLERHRPRVLFSVFGETHPAGHYFWGSDEGDAPPETPDELRFALRDVYRALDEAVGQLLDALDGRADVLIVSGHGFGPDNTPDLVLPELLVRMGMTARPGAAQGDAGTPRPSLKQRVRQAARGLVPGAVRHAIYQRTVPLDVRERRSLRAARGDIDFARSKAFCLPTDLHGLIRINLEGREPDGTVAPDEYDAICDELEAELRSLTNTASGEKVVAQVFRTRRVYPDGDNLDYLPDLCVLWNMGRPIPAVRSPQYGVIDSPARRPEQTGHHRPEGFFFALGPHIDTGAQGLRGHILDIAPTIFRLLGKDIPDDWDGEVLGVLR